MQALVFTAPGVVEVRDEPEPTPGPDDVVVEVAASGICGSELHGFRSVGMRVPPLILGHELTGTDDEGRRVVVNPLLACGHCDSCRRAEPQVCRTRRLLGAHLPGGLAERVAVPRSAVHVLPDAVGFVAGSLIEPLANGVHAWSLVGEVPARVGVVGGGPIGLLTMLVARRHGAEVTVADTSAARREVAAGLGATSVEALTGEYDVVVDAVGASATRAAAMAALRPGGTSVWLGLAHDASPVSGHALVRGEHSIIGSFAYTDADFAEAVDLAGDLDLTWASPVPLSSAAAAFLALADGGTAQVKAVVVPDARLDEVTAR